MKIRALLLFLVLIPLWATSAPHADYKVQVGDIVRVSLPGEESLDKTFEVDRLGRIFLPEVGAVEVVNLSEQAMEDKVRGALSLAFQDLLHMRVFIFKQQLLIQVLGYVENPGEVVLPAGASVQAALREAGGMRPGAQLDSMQLRREGTTQIFNYKKYLDSGETSLLPTLKSLDVVFVPASPKIGNVEVEFDPAKVADAGDAASEKSAIKVFGEVNSPGSFAYKDEVSLIDLLMRSGGVTRYAGVEQIRVITKGEPELFNLKAYLDSGDQSLLPPMEPGATIFVPRQEEAVKTGANTVYVMGEVFEPGAYESNKGATFMDILANAGGPTRYAESRQIRILKSDGSVLRFDLAGYTEGTVQAGPPQILPGDAIFVPEKVDMNEKSWLKITPDRAVRVLGEVVRPGRVEWSQEMSLLDLLAHVGGPTSRADTASIDLLIPNENGEAVASSFNLDAYMKEGMSDSELPVIRAGSTVRIHDLPVDPSDNKSQWVRQAPEKSIYIMGQVGAPGRYSFTEDMGFLDILAAADGPTKDADLRRVRISHRNGPHAKVSKLDLALYFETGDEHLLPKVKPGDTIYVPDRSPVWLDQPKESTIRILGAINKPGRYRFDDNMTLLDVLAEAGGPSNTAYLKKIAVINSSCCDRQARTFNLVKFSRKGDFSLLPVLRAGDTIFIPDRTQSKGSKAREALGDVFRLVSMGALLGVF